MKYQRDLLLQVLRTWNDNEDRISRKKQFFFFTLIFEEPFSFWEFTKKRELFIGRMDQSLEKCWIENADIFVALIGSLLNVLFQFLIYSLLHSSSDGILGCLYRYLIEFFKLWSKDKRWQIIMFMFDNIFIADNFQRSLHQSMF